MELRPDSVVNLGIGIPEGVANAAAEEHILDYLTLTAEPGAMGGMPAGGLDFGSAVNAQAILDQPSQFDFYDGGGLRPRSSAWLRRTAWAMSTSAGSGRSWRALEDSSTSARTPSGWFHRDLRRAEPLPSAGRPTGHRQRAIAPEFLADVQQRTFSGQYAVAAGQPVLYVTERCVFQLTPDGLELTEIAPGVDLDKDVLAHIGFEPIIRCEPKLMDARIFAAGPMGLKDDLLTMPLEARFAYDAERNIFFLNMEGMSLVSEGEVQAIGTEVDGGLAVIGKKVQMVIDYDTYSLDPALADDYKALIRSLADRYYASATRYTTSSFMRLKLSEHLSERGLAPTSMKPPGSHEWRGKQISSSAQNRRENRTMNKHRHQVVTEVQETCRRQLNQWPSSVVDSMGAGIAESASIAGVPVIIRELPEFIDAARARLEKSLDGAVKLSRRPALPLRQSAAEKAARTVAFETACGGHWGTVPGPEFHLCSPEPGHQEE